MAFHKTLTVPHGRVLPLLPARLPRHADSVGQSCVQLRRLGSDSCACMLQPFEHPGLKHGDECYDGNE
jgi:hypothetical protein